MPACSIEGCGRQESKQRGNSNFFIIITLFGALFALGVGILLVNTHFKNARKEFAVGEFSKSTEMAKQAISERKWDEAIRVLNEIKESTSLDGFADERERLFADVDRLVWDAERKKAEYRADIC
jgi:hypothetical protein